MPAVSKPWRQKEAERLARQTRRQREAEKQARQKLQRSITLAKTLEFSLCCLLLASLAGIVFSIVGGFYPTGFWYLVAASIQLSLYLLAAAVSRRVLEHKLKAAEAEHYRLR